MDGIIKEASFEGRKKLRMDGLMSNAYADYIAARVLFNARMLREGCILANQSLEKQMKAYIEMHTNIEDKSHDTVKLYNTMVYHKYPIADVINKDFIKVLKSIYMTRYYEQLSSQYRYTIIQYKFLAELDYIMSKFLPKLTIKGKNGPGKSSYTVDIENNNPNLFLNNHVLNNIPKGTFLAQKQITEDFLLFGNSTIIIGSEVNAAADNKKFIYPGLKITSPTTMQIMDWGLEEFGIRTFKRDNEGS